MQKLLTISLNHKSCSMQSLGKLTAVKHAVDDLIPSFMQEDCIDEVVSIATCNRLEFVIACSDTGLARHAVWKHLSNYLEHTYSEIESQSQLFINDEAVVHLFHLVSGLESLVTGDAQILGQVKHAYHAAVEKGTVGKTLHTLFQKSFATAKKVRTQTGLGKGRVSISALAVDYIRRHIHDVSAASVAVIGAGKMGELCIKYLADMPFKQITLINRTTEKCQPLADEYPIRIAGFDQLTSVITEADYVISATSACEYVIKKSHVCCAEKAVSKPRVFIDIAMPQDIDPAIAELRNARLTGLDDLRAIANENQAQRAAATTQALAIIQHDLDAMGSWPLPIQVDTVTAMMGEYACNVLQEETGELFALLRDLTAEQRELITVKISRIAERLVLAPRRMLRETAAHKLPPEAIEVLDELFRSGIQANSTLETKSLEAKK